MKGRVQGLPDAHNVQQGMNVSAVDLGAAARFPSAHKMSYTTQTSDGQKCTHTWGSLIIVERALVATVASLSRLERDMLALY